MNDQQLQYFLKIAEKQNLTLAAQELILSPPALTATLRRLESELGCRLFDRRGRNIILSDCGQILLRHAKTALSALDSAKEEIAQTMQHSDTRLTIGLTSPLVCHDAIKAFLSLHPEIQLTHHVLRLDQLSSPSLKHEVQFVVASKDDVKAIGWEGQLMKSNNPLMLAVYPSHPFANRNHIHLDELAKERLIAVPKEYCFRHFMDSVFEQAGLSPNLILECDFALRPTMLSAQHGVLLCTAFVKGTSFSPDTVFIPVTEPEIHYPSYIFRHSNSMRSAAAELFWDFMVSFYQGDT